MDGFVSATQVDPAFAAHALTAEVGDSYVVRLECFEEAYPGRNVECAVAASEFDAERISRIQRVDAEPLGVQTRRRPSRSGCGVEDVIDEAGGTADVQMRPCLLYTSDAADE